jgi:hypothetical protein
MTDPGLSRIEGVVASGTGITGVGKGRPGVLVEEPLRLDRITERGVGLLGIALYVLSSRVPR